MATKDVSRQLRNPTWKYNSAVKIFIGHDKQFCSYVICHHCSLSKVG